MKTFIAMTKRNVKLFFKDKGMFFSSLITPLILLVLYATFLAKVYRDSFMSNIPQDFAVENLSKMIDGLVGSMLLSSLLAVSCVTVAFCSNLIMVQDKYLGVRKDLLVTPVRKSTLSLSYFAATMFSTVIVCSVACVAGFIYLAAVGWYMSFADVVLVLVDVLLLTSFGTALSSVVNVFIKTNGQATAVGTIVSACYGFLCGAYMPISNFSDGLQKTMSLLPGTYGTSLIRNHALRGVFEEMSAQGFPDEVVDGIAKSLDCKLSFFGNDVSIGAMHGVLIGTTAVLIGSYVLICALKKDKN